MTYPDSSSFVPDMEPPRRSTGVRILFSLVWLIPIYFLVFALAGGIAGALSVDQLPAEAPSTIAESYNQGAAVGRQAAQDLIRAHGGKLFLLVLVLNFGLSYQGILPGTGRYKKRRAQ